MRFTYLGVCLVQLSMVQAQRTVGRACQMNAGAAKLPRTLRNGREYESLTP